MWSSHSGTTHVSSNTLLSHNDTLQYSTRLASVRLLQALPSVNTLKRHICRTHDSPIIIWFSSHIPYQNHKKFTSHTVWHFFPEVYYFFFQFKHSTKQSININHQNTHSLTDNDHVYLSITLSHEAKSSSATNPPLTHFPFQHLWPILLQTFRIPTLPKQCHFSVRRSSYSDKISI